MPQFLTTRHDERNETYMIDSSEQINHFLLVPRHEFDGVKNFLLLAMSEHGKPVDIISKIVINEGLSENIKSL